MALMQALSAEQRRMDSSETMAMMLEQFSVQPALVGKEAALTWMKQGFSMARSKIGVMPREVQVTGP